MKRPLATLCSTFAAGAALGWTLAHLSGGTTWLAARNASPVNPGQLSEAQRGARPSPDAPLPTELWRLATRVASLESLIEELQEGRGDVQALGAQALAAMSDAELSSALMSAVRLSEEEIGDVRDLRAFSKRMLEVAMLGITEPEQSLTEAEPIRFSGTSPGSAAGKTSGGRFPSGRGRIFATFPVPDPARQRVLVKWFRTDRPHILLLRRYSLKAGESSGYVWLEPEGGWESGNYQVDVYAADEAVTPLATGRYEIW